MQQTAYNQCESSLTIVLLLYLIYQSQAEDKTANNCQFTIQSHFHVEASTSFCKEALVLRKAMACGKV